MGSYGAWVVEQRDAAVARAEAAEAEVRALRDPIVAAIAALDDAGVALANEHLNDEAMATAVAATDLRQAIGAPEERLALREWAATADPTPCQECGSKPGDPCVVMRNGLRTTTRRWPHRVRAATADPTPAPETHDGG